MVLGWLAAWMRLIRSGWSVRWRFGLGVGMLLAALISFQRASGYGQVGSGYILPMESYRVWIWDVPIYIVIGFLFFVLAPWRWGFEFDKD